MFWKCAKFRSFHVFNSIFFELLISSVTIIRQSYKCDHFRFIRFWEVFHDVLSNLSGDSLHSCVCLVSGDSFPLVASCSESNTKPPASVSVGYRCESFVAYNHLRRSLNNYFMVYCRSSFVAITVTE